MEQTSCSFIVRSSSLWKWKKAYALLRTLTTWILFVSSLYTVRLRNSSRSQLNLGTTFSSKGTVVVGLRGLGHRVLSSCLSFLSGWLEDYSVTLQDNFRSGGLQVTVKLASIGLPSSKPLLLLRQLAEEFTNSYGSRIYNFCEHWCSMLSSRKVKHVLFGPPTRTGILKDPIYGILWPGWILQRKVELGRNRNNAQNL